MWIETDLEPDDIIALAILPKADYYVVGESDANIKYNRMINYSKLLHNENAIIIQGFDSDAKFDTDGLEFDFIGKKICTENYENRFEEFCKKPNPCMFSIKPMREIIDLFIRKSEKIKKLVSNVELFAYGGFNFRCIENKVKLIELLSLFKKVSIYESFYSTGEINSMDKTCVDIYNLITNSNVEIFNVLKKLTINWNNYRFKKLSAIKNPSVRQSKIIANIKDNINFQFVLADFALAAIYRDIKPVPITNLSMDQYMTFHYAPASTIFIYKDIPKQTIFDLILKYLLLVQ